MGALVRPERCPRLLRSRAPGQHAFVITYSRHWKRLWRKRHSIRCWYCTLVIFEP